MNFNSQVKPRELLRLLRDEAKMRGLPPVIIKHGKLHDQFICGNIVAVIPRHGDIASGTLHSILKSFEPLFGERWWK